MVFNGDIYAFLVGIDDYPATIPSLRGCANDIENIEIFLQERTIQSGSRLHLKSVLNQNATRQNIINGFREHLKQARSDDTAVFYYSGHGSQEPAPPEFWAIEPDRLNETLVCYDSRIGGCWDLADKELAKLIAEVAEQKPHIVIILDCCHSGSGTRDMSHVSQSRRIPVDKRRRPLSGYIFAPEEVETLSTKRGQSQPSSGWTLPQGRHVLLTACRDNQEAKEYYRDGCYRGVFSCFLTETLQRANGSLTYRDLFKRANALVQSKVTDQSPQLEATELSDLERPFLGGAIVSRTPYFTVSYHSEYAWVIDGGAVHGLQSPISNGEATILALFPYDSSIDQLQQQSQVVATAEVREVLPQLSKLKIRNKSEQLTTDATFKAVVISLPLTPLTVSLEGSAEGIKLIRQALQETGPAKQPSLYVCEVSDGMTADYQVEARDLNYWITSSMNNLSLVSKIQGDSLVNATKVVQQLESIARWQAILELASPAGSRIPPGAVQMEIMVRDEVMQADDLRLAYQLEQNKWRPPTLQVKLINTWQAPLYCSLLNLTEQFSIVADLFLSGGVWLQPEEEAWAFSGEPLYCEVPKELWQQGVTEYQDVLKLIVSTTEFDATLLAQDKLNQLQERGLKTPSKGKGTLNRLMCRVRSRELSRKPEEEELYDDWITSQVKFTTVRPQHATAVSAESSIDLAAGVTLQAHPHLKADARLSTIAQSSRDFGKNIVPPILRENPEFVQPFQFTASRGTDPGLSSLEFRNVVHHTAVTPEVPLKLVMEGSLSEGEYLLPIAYDGEFFLPLGLGQTVKGKIEITLNGLPKPVSEGQRSVTGSIRIFFQKVVSKKLGEQLSQKLGLQFEYPIIAAVEMQDSDVSYLTNQDHLKAEVAKAESIVLFIHGIFGDTESMVPSLETAMVPIEGHATPISELYDLVLTFDYENINTSITINAQKLKRKLREIGLGPNHGKTLHIVAHSMGGLVSRWLIEQEDGNEIVQHLFLLGTPSAGSPWPEVQAGVTAVLAFALNGLGMAILPLKLLGSILEQIEKVDVTLDEMQPESDFLEELAAGNDPKIPYSIIAGNTSLIPTDAREVLRQRLWEKLSKAVELPFMGKANDIAVTVESIKSVSSNRQYPPQTQEVACNHLVYFTHPAGLTALGNAIAAANKQGIQSTHKTKQPLIAIEIDEPQSEEDASIQNTSFPSGYDPELSQGQTNNQELSLHGESSKQAWLSPFLVILSMSTVIGVGIWWQHNQTQKLETLQETSQLLERIFFVSE